MAAGVVLKVKPDILKSKAEEISGYVEDIKSQWNNLYQIINENTQYWQGDASDIQRKSVLSVNEEMENICQRLLEHPSDLLNMAEVYSKTEENIKSTIDVLPVDFIS